MAGINDGAASQAFGVGTRAANQHAGHGLNWSLGGREPNPNWAVTADVFEAFEGEGEVRTALVASHGVDLVDDHGLNGA